MAYEAALEKAWRALESTAQEKPDEVPFLSERYTVDVANKRILSLSSRAPAKTHLCILILHYLARKIKGLAALKEEWISFKELEGGAFFYPAFRKRVIDTLLRKIGKSPEVFFRRLHAREAGLADISVILDTFENVPLLLAYWKGDEEVPSEADVLFDKSIAGIFCTEDVAVLADTVVRNL